MSKFYLSLAGVLAFSGLGIMAPSVMAEPSAISPEMQQYAQEAVTPASPTAQNVTSVSQLSDVKPTDWAFTALQSLVERYGCIAGYPDRTFRGQRSLTRFEFAAGLNACLDKINEILTAGLADKASKEDLAAIQKLQEEFAAELAALKGRVDTLESKTATLEAQQFSTTTKLEGQAIISFSGSGSGDTLLRQPALDLAGRPVLSEQPGNANTTAIARVRLNFNTSFTGEDMLITRLEAGNNGSNAANFLDQPDRLTGFTGFANSSALDYSGAGTNFSLGKLVYEFPIGKDITVAVGPVISLNDYVDHNSFANDEASDFSSGMFINNPLILPVNGGAGAVISWNFGSGPITLRAAYVAANGEFAAADNDINRGLFGDPYQGTVELEFSPKDGDKPGPFALRLQYTGASVNNLEYSIGGVNLEWAIAKGFGIFGRYGFGSISNRGNAIADALPTYVNASFRGSNLNPSTWSAGFAFPDLFKEGALAAIAVGQPFIEGNVGNSTQTNLELFYKIPVSDNIHITPDLQFIFNPNNNSANGTITVGTIRTVFSF
ncbi:iron uptake porin [Pseudanabaena sp. PCC 6802]|uniref:iron uptake porin n=1 Tax=Pseudanabaena sp. PCC 6802 TaxID=118173 RepID=UPI00034A4859|nr:iron uptake porin [Pseudanabaena sp. PCC 6802]